MISRATLLRTASACFFVAAVVLWALFITSCATVSTRIDPPLRFAPTPLQAWFNAEQEAYTEGGDVYYVQNTHSMEPTLWGGDYLVVAPRPFSERVVGEVKTYNADWMPDTEPNVTHRSVAKDGGGFIMSGDNSPISEARWRMTERNYVGLVTGIWRVKV